MLKQKILAFTLSMGLIAMPLSVLADSVPGETIVTLGQNLTETQKKALLSEMGAPADARTVTVSNQEEHKYLDGTVPKAQIGTRALSSAMITIGEKNTGIIVQTNNISWVSNAMYTNALITAGLKDANIVITAPFEVSGTAALTGIMKAYELSSGEAIPEEVKKVANEEMVKTAKLADTVGNEKAVQLVAQVKEEIAKNPNMTTDELKDLVNRLAGELGINLTSDQMASLMALFEKMKDLNINWDQVGNQLTKAKEQISDFLNSEQGQSFIQKLKDFFSALFDAILSFFK
ncbi:hypothetical protein GCM10007380_11280 [Gottfriedia solisilvae]|uniref:DUF1002 domain-containing protein n=1 Tax=Gottfriedia solisilvae TaxID=1516104 RepID=A0A8J3AE13_9BACI|nr:hypothetical protein GCM10007380_11280 [Gottfriedia solisilvae]